MTTFLAIVADDEAAGASFFAIAHLFSILPVVCDRFLRTRSGGDPSDVLESSGILVSSTEGVVDTLPTTGAESRAVNSGELGGGEDRADGGSSGTSSGLRIGKSPERGGPGGSRKAVTAVQLSARNLFIIQ